jgi:hypothetical protein
MFKDFLKESIANDKLLAIAKKAGSDLFDNPSHGRSGFVYLDNPKVVRMTFDKFKSQINDDDDEDPHYNTMQVPFKPSTGKAYDKSDKPIEKSDFDKDGLLYVLDSDVGVLVIKDEKSSGVRPPETEKLNKWKAAVEHEYGKVTFQPENKYHQIVAVQGGKPVGVFEYGSETRGSVFPRSYDANKPVYRHGNPYAKN